MNQLLHFEDDEMSIASLFDVKSFAMLFTHADRHQFDRAHSEHACFDVRSISRWIVYFSPLFSI